jgi:predicted dehydrogenase
MRRIGLVGCGFISRIHSWALKALRKAELVDARVTCVFDPDLERAGEMARHHQAHVAATLDELLERVDVVYVCTPTATHLDIVSAASARGLAIYCEKPLAPSLAECKQVAAALCAVPHQVGLVLRSAPVFRRIHELLVSQTYGRTMAIHLRDDQFFPNQGHYASSWRASVQMAGGGTLIEHSIHDLDLFRWLAGDPDGLTCQTASFFGHPGIEDLAALSLTYPDGSTAQLLSVWHQVLTRGSTRRLEVFCERAMLWTEDDYTGPLHVETSEGAEVLACEPAVWVDELPVPQAVRRPLGQYAEASKAFLDGLSRSDGPPPPGAVEALAAHHLVDAAYRSAAQAGSMQRC